jgi:hypothetical protein
MYYYKFFKLVYEKLTYKDTHFVSDNLWINLKTYLYKQFSQAQKYVKSKYENIIF